MGQDSIHCLAYINLSLMKDHNGTSDALLSDSAQPWCPGALGWSGHSFPIHTGFRSFGEGL